MARKRETALEKRRRKAKDGLASIKSWKATMDAASKGLSKAITEFEKDLADIDYREGQPDGEIPKE